MHKLVLLAINLFVTSTLVSCNFQPPLVNNFGTKDEKLKADKQAKLPPCKSCSIFVESFKKVYRVFHLALIVFKKFLDFS
jgi:hypothetical protein